jgi:hypothetical protein
MDDMHILLPIENVASFQKCIAKLGAPVGVIIGKDNRKILTNINGISTIVDFSDPTTKQSHCEKHSPHSPHAPYSG